MSRAAFPRCLAAAPLVWPPRAALAQGALGRRVDERRFKINFRGIAVGK